MSVIVGTAGWSIPAKDREHFGSDGSALQRYAQRFQGVEVNSSFHRPHRASTWARWRQSVPAGFRFAVKVPKTISHQRKLVDCAELVEGFLGQVGALEEKLAVLLLQLPPKLAFDGAVAEDFLAKLTTLTPVRIVCEPRHPSWFDAGADALLDRLRVARAAADPATTPEGALPGGWRGFSYWRLHGSPTMYRSAYGTTRLDDYAALIRAGIDQGRKVWCMFDNTAASAATGDALALMAKLR